MEFCPLSFEKGDAKELENREGSVFFAKKVCTNKPACINQSIFHCAKVFEGGFGEGLLEKSPSPLRPILFYRSHRLRSGSKVLCTE